MLDVSAPEPRPARPFHEYRSASRIGVVLQLAVLVAATTVIVGAAVASVFAGVLYQLSAIAR